MEVSTDFSNFSVKCCHPLIRIDSVTHMHGLANSEHPYLCLGLALLHLVFYFNFLYRSPSSLCTVFFEAISSNIGEVFLINPSANVYVYSDFNVQC